MKQATINAIRAKAKVKASALAKEAETKLVNMYEDLVDIFYDEHEPTQYIRSYNFRDNSYFPYSKQVGARYYGGIVVSEKQMQPYDTPNVLFGVLYNPKHTWHGKPELAASFVLYQKMHNYHEDLLKEFGARCTVK